MALALEGGPGHAEFARLLRACFPDWEAEVLWARHGGLGRETARVQALIGKLDEELFPVNPFVEEYGELLWRGIPIRTFGCGGEDLHDLDREGGYLLLLSLVEDPYGPGFGCRAPLLDACEAYVPAELLLRLPEGGIPTAELQARLDGTAYAAAAGFARWVEGSTGSVFLDHDPECELLALDWTPETVAWLRAQWAEALALMERVRAFGRWLELGLPDRYAKLLDAALADTAVEREITDGQER